MRSLTSAINEHLEQNNVSFHSPAHCGTVHARDLSELTGLDDLQYPSGVLLKAEEQTADLFGAQRSFFLVNGASVGIMAALLAVKNHYEMGIQKNLISVIKSTQTNKSEYRTPKILLPRNAHKSVISGIILAGFDVEWLEPEWLSDWGVYGCFSRQEIEERIAKDNYAAVILTNPTYEGFYSDLPQLNIPLIVDEAHAAHYHFSDELPKPALLAGADIVIQSWHKTLGSMTQTGVLHVAHNSKIPSQIVQDNLRLLQTTSPSYVLMESLVQRVEELRLRGEEIFAEAIARARRILVPERALNHDPLRVLFKLADYSGSDVDNAFEDEGIILESCSFNSVLAFINYANTDKDVLRFNEAYKKVFARTDLAKAKSLRPRFAEQVLNPRIAFYSAYEDLGLKDSIGRVCQELYAPCPPGIPLLVPGQVIRAENIEILMNKKSSVKVLIAKNITETQSSLDCGYNNSIKGC